MKSSGFLFHFAPNSCDRFKMKLLFHFVLIVDILYFISFCVDGVRSVLNDTHFVSC